MSNNISPEERLFNAIEKNEGVSSALKPKPRKAFDFLRAGVLLRVFNPKHITHGAQGMTHEAYLKLADRLLAVLAMVLMFFLITDLMLPKYNVDELYAVASDLGDWEFKKSNIVPLKPFPFYKEGAEAKDLFNPAFKQGGEAGGQVNLKLQELAKDLSLVGIYWGTHPEVMVEDTAAKKTYFLKKGDEMKGIKIKNILKDRVILNYGDEEMEFR